MLGNIFDFCFEFAKIFYFSCIQRVLSIRTDSFHVFSVYDQIHSAYSQCTNRFIPRILSILTAKFSSKIYLIPHILHLRTYSFRVFSVYKQIRSAYSQYTYRFILRIQRMRPNNFEYSELNYFHYSF